MGINFIKPKVKILYNGVDKTHLMTWHNIKIEDNEGDEADKLNINLVWGNAKPRVKDEIKIYVNDNFLGSFIIVSLKYEYKRNIEIEAISADFTKDFKTKKNRTFLNTTYANIIKQLARENSYNYKIDFIRSDEIVTLEQHDQSDVAFLDKMAKDLNLSFSIKNNTLIFFDRDKQSNRITYSYHANNAISFNWEEKETIKYNSCEVTWHNTKSGMDEVVRVGQKEPVLKITSMQDSKDRALMLANTKLQNQQNEEQSANLKILGEPFFAGGFLLLSVDEKDEPFKFIIKKITHEINTSWQSSLELF
jgi:putative phage tail protein D|nr:MAG TPA: tail protein [Caudoviricetes sp.]